MDADALAARVLAWPLPDAVPNGPRIVAVDGPSGAGKTTLARDLADALARTAGRTEVVHLDGLYPGWDGLDAAVPLLVRRVLAPLAAGTPVSVPTWDWERDRPGPERALTRLGPPSPAAVVVEGVGAGARAASRYLAGIVWLEGPEAQRRARALARDGDAYAPHWQRWADQERAHFARERTRERAGIVLAPGPAPGEVVERCR